MFKCVTNSTACCPTVGSRPIRRAISKSTAAFASSANKLPDLSTPADAKKLRMPIVEHYLFVTFVVK